MLQNWCANVDLQVIVDMTACAQYMAKYVSKCEPHSKTMDTSNPMSAFRKAMIQIVGERPWCTGNSTHLTVHHYTAAHSTL